MMINQYSKNNILRLMRTICTIMCMSVPLMSKILRSSTMNYFCSDI